jgi:TRAP-type C4-dicarboxylate transport system permease small subunit
MMVLFVALFIIVMAGIISRVVFNSPFTWTEEAARLVFIWLVFMGISYGTKYDKHINVTIMLDKMPKKVAAVFTIFWDLVALVVFVWVAFNGVKYISYMGTSVTSVLRINQGLTTSIVAISAILNVIRIIEKMVTEHIPHFKEV